MHKKSIHFTRFGLILFIFHKASVASILPDFYHSASSLNKRPIKACFSVAFLLFAKMLFFDFSDAISAYR